jgi:hypothetical protein
MKTVFKSRELAHLWVSGTQQSGRCLSNMHFEGGCYYSYSTVIASRIRQGSKVAYVLDRASFSNTTSKHQGFVRRALPNDAQWFAVSIGQRNQYLQFTAATLRDHYLTRAKDIEAGLPSRYARIRAEQYGRATMAIQNARQVCAFFGLGTARIDAILAKRAAGQGEAEVIMKAAREKALKAEADRQAKTLRERTERAILEAKRFITEPEPRDKRHITLGSGHPDLLPPELAVQLATAIEIHNKSIVQAGLDGQEIVLPYDYPTLCRREGSELVTSRGARVPMEAAERTYRFAKKHPDWHRNGDTHAVGPYQLDAVNAQGIVAGCHRIAWDEIERFAKQEGWVTA